MSFRVIAILASLLMLLSVAQRAARAEDTVTTQPAAGGGSSDISPAIAAFMQPVQLADGDDELRQKLKERHNTAVHLLELRVDEYHKGLSDLTPVFEAARLVGEAKLDLAQNADERRAALEQTLAASNVLQSRIEKQLQKGFGSEADLTRARLVRETAEVELLKLKGGGAPATQPR
jgi:hypothetical protein